MDDARSTTPSRAKTRSTTATGATGSPPRLRFHVLKRVKMLLLFNIMPLICTTYLYWQWQVGNVTFKTISEESRITFIAVIIAGIFFITVCWFLMPIAIWLRDYPACHLRFLSVLWWIVPAIGGGMWVTSILAGTAAVAVLVVGIWRLFSLAGA
jgi:hypothetical protein